MLTSFEHQMERSIILGLLRLKRLEQLLDVVQGYVVKSFFYFKLHKSILSFC